MSRRRLGALVSIVLAAAATEAGAQPLAIANARVEVVAATGGLAATLRDLSKRGSEAFWLGYAVAAAEGRRGSCCYWTDHLRPDGACCVGCRLESAPAGGPPVTTETTGGAVRLEGAPMVNVLARVERGVVGKIRSFAEDCPLDAGGRTVFWLSGVAPGDSLAWLVSMLDGDQKIAQGAVAAIAIHADSQATSRLIALAHEHASSRVRGEALFWLARRAGARAAAAITNAIANDPETEVKKRAVFALAQLPKDEGVPRLIQVARTNRNPEVRKQAMFWLGQSKDPRALAFFEEILR